MALKRQLCPDFYFSVRIQWLLVFVLESVSKERRVLVLKQISIRSNRRYSFAKITFWSQFISFNNSKIAFAGFSEAVSFDYYSALDSAGLASSVIAAGSVDSAGLASSVAAAGSVDSAGLTSSGAADSVSVGASASVFASFAGFTT